MDLVGRKLGMGGGAHLQRFAGYLEDLGLTPTVRRNRGTDIDAACGQLRERATTDGAAPSARLSP